jgi:N-methylhydantoinase A
LGAEEAEPRAAVDGDALREAFAAKHEERYGYRDEEAEVELVTVRVSAWGWAPELELVSAGTGEPAPRGETRKVVFEGEEVEAECLRGELAHGTRVSGPAICALGEATLWVPPGWSGEVDEQGSVRLSAQGEEPSGGRPRNTGPRAPRRTRLP